MKKIIIKLLLILLFNFKITLPTVVEPETKKPAPKILKYGDRVRLRFAGLPNKTLYTDEFKYFHKDSSQGQQVSGFLDINAYKEYQKDKAYDEWIIFGPDAMYDDFIKGKSITSGARIRIYNPKTNSKLQFHLSPQYKSPLPTMLEVTTVPNVQLSNTWIITIQKNASENGEIIYGKTLFTIEAQNDQEQKYLTVSSAEFKIVSDIRNFRKQPVVGLDKKNKNYWFIEKLDEEPKKPPVEEKIVVEKVEEKEKIEKKVEEEKIVAKIPEYENLMWGTNSFGKALFRVGKNWQYVGDGFAVKIIDHITVGPQNTIWIIDHKNNLYFKKEGSRESSVTTPWTPITDDGITDFIDVSAGANGSVWAIGNKKILFRNNITKDNLMGSGWSESKIANLAPNEKIVQLSVGPTGSIVAISDQGNTYFKQISAEKLESAPWKKVNFVGIKNTKQICLGPNGTCWAINNNHEIYFLQNITDGTSRWYRVQGILSQIVISPQGSVWGVHPGGLLYKRNGITTATPTGKGWQNITSNVYSFAFSSDGTPFCILRGGFNLYKKENLSFSQFAGNSIFSMQENKWVEISLDEIPTTVEISSINFTSYGTTFAKDSLGNIYQRSGISPSNLAGTGWTQIDSPKLIALHLAKDKNGTILMGTDINNKLLKLKTDITIENPNGKTATPDPNLPKFSVKQFLITSNGVRLALSAEGIFYFQKEETWTSDRTENLLQIALDEKEIDEKLEISLWGINADNKVLFKNNITPQNTKGSSWLEVSGKKMQEIFVRPNGKIWGLSFEEHSKYRGNYQVYAREGISKENPQGTNWKSAKTYVAKLPNTPQKVIHYGDEISICNVYDENDPGTPSGLFIDTSSKIITLNGLNGKNYQQLKILNPANTADRSIIKNNNSLILKTYNNEYLAIKKIGEIFILQTDSNKSKATTFAVNNNLGSATVEYGQRIFIQTKNKYLNHLHSQAIQSNLTLIPQPTTNFFIFKPITTQRTVDQKSIDQISSPVSTLIKQSIKPLQNVEDGQKAFAQIIKVLDKNKNKIDSVDLETIMQTVIYTEKKDLLSEEDRKNVMQNILPNIKENKGAEIQPILKKVTSKFKEELKNITDPGMATLRFIELLYNNKSMLTFDELQDLRNLLLNLQDARFLTDLQKAKTTTMLGGLDEEKITTEPTKPEVVKPVEPPIEPAEKKPTKERRRQRKETRRKTERRPITPTSPTGIYLKTEPAKTPEMH